MNTGIYYLYEYKNRQKLRNTGFLKITRQERTCFLQFNARGLPVTPKDTLSFSAFYMENGTANTSHLSDISCGNRTVSGKITSTETLFPNQCTLNRIDGFFLTLPHGEILAATAPNVDFDTRKVMFLKGKRTIENTDLEHRNPQSEQHPEPHSDLSETIQLTEVNTDSLVSVQPTETYTDSRPPAEVITDSAESIQLTDAGTNPTVSRQFTETNINSTDPVHLTDTDTDSAESVHPTETSSDAQNVEQPTEAHFQNSETSQSTTITEINADIQEVKQLTASHSQKPETSQHTQDTEPQKEHPQSESPKSSARKIQRSELSALPRRHWNLANNSFLLHGYYNYNHLLLVEEEGHYWLGVPGIYDPRESRAAELFGFSQFTDSYNKQLALSKEECSDYGRFGYWCRYLK